MPKDNDGKKLSKLLEMKAKVDKKLAKLQGGQLQMLCEVVQLVLFDFVHYGWCIFANRLIF